MRKILIVLLAILLLTSCPILSIGVEQEPAADKGTDANEEIQDTQENVYELDQTKENDEPQEPEDELDQTSAISNTGEDITLNITDVTADQEIVYGWDLAASLADEQSSKNNELTALFKVQAVRQEKANDLIVFVKADLDQETIVDTVDIELGHKVDDSFEAIKTFNVSEFDQTITEGFTTIAFDTAINLLNFDEDELELLQNIRLSIGVKEEDNHTTLLKDTHNFSLPQRPQTVDEVTEIETNLFEALSELGTTDATEDDWSITETDLDADNIFEDNIEIIFNEVRDAKDMVVTVQLKGDEGKILETTEATLTFDQEELLQNILDEVQENVYEPEDKLDQTSGSSNTNKDYTLNITDVTTNQDIVYGWDLSASLAGEQSSKTTELTALFNVQAVRQEKANDLIVSVKANVDQETIVDTVDIELGHKVDDRFEAIKTFKVNEFDQIITGGITTITFNTTINLLDFNEDELASLENIRLSIDVKEDDDHTTLVKDTRSFSLPQRPQTVNEGTEIETNLLEALSELGTTDATQDDWIITETDLDADNIFEDNIEIILSRVKDAKDMVVTVQLKGDDSKILESIDVTLTFGKEELLPNIGDGEVHHIHGFWMSPVTEEFVLGKRSVPISFWLDEALTEAPSLCIFKPILDDSENIIDIGEPVAVITNSKLRTGNCGRNAKTWGKNQSEAYYRFILKARKTPALSDLEEGTKYVLAVMIGDELLTFDEDTPATLSFIVENDVSTTTKAKRLNLKRDGSNRTPGFGSSNRTP